MSQEYLFGVIVHCLSMTSTVWNPILYAWLNEQFRLAFVDLAQSCRRRGQRRGSHIRLPVSSFFSHFSSLLCTYVLCAHLWMPASIPVPWNVSVSYPTVWRRVDLLVHPVLREPRNLIHTCWTFNMNQWNILYVDTWMKKLVKIAAECVVTVRHAIESVCVERVFGHGVGATERLSTAADRHPQLVQKKHELQQGLGLEFTQCCQQPDQSQWHCPVWNTEKVLMLSRRETWSRQRSTTVQLRPGLVSLFPTTSRSPPTRQLLSSAKSRHKSVSYDILLCTGSFLPLVFQFICSLRTNVGYCIPGPKVHYHRNPSSLSSHNKLPNNTIEFSSSAVESQGKTVICAFSLQCYWNALN